MSFLIVNEVDIDSRLEFYFPDLTKSPFMVLTSFASQEVLQVLPLLHGYASFSGVKARSFMRSVYLCRIDLMGIALVTIAWTLLRLLKLLESDVFHNLLRSERLLS